MREGTEDMKTVFVTGADRGLGMGIAHMLLKAGHRVFAGQFMPGWPELAEMQRQFPGKLTIVPLDVGDIGSAKAAAKAVEKEAESLDVLINNAGILSKYDDAHIRDGQDYDALMKLYNINALGPIRTTEAFMPLLDKGAGKRLCYVSSEAGSLGTSNRKNWFAYCMSKCALNMGVAILFNDLRPDGYTFRVYHPGYMRTYMMGEKNMAATYEPDEAGAFAVNYFLSETGTYNEDRLILRDNTGKEWPW